MKSRLIGVLAVLYVMIVGWFDWGLGVVRCRFTWFCGVGGMILGENLG